MANRIEIIIDSVTTGLEKGLGKTQTGFQKFSKTALVAGAAIAGGLAIGLDKSVKAALEAQKATTRLNTSFKDAGLSASKYAKQIDAAEASGRKLGFTDEETKTALGSLITATGNMAKAQRDLGVAQDIARFKSVGLGDATKMLTMAMTGSQRAAKQLGISVPTVTAAYDDLGKKATVAEKAHAKFIDKQATGQAVIDAVSAKLHGQAAAFSSTAAGGIAVFHAQMEHLEVTLGTAVLPAIVAITSKLSELATYLSKHTTLAKALVIGLGALAAALLAAAAAQAILNLAVLANPFVAVGVAIAALAAGLIYLQVKYQAVTKAVDFLKDHLYLLLAVPIVGQTAFIAAEIIKHWTTVKAIAGGAISALTSTVNALVGAYQAVHSAGTAAASAVQSAWNTARGAVTSAMSAIETAIHGVVTAFHTVSSAIGAVVGVIEALVGAIKSIPHDISIHVHVPGAGLLHKIPGLASGGPVVAGQSYLVGEKGPELFTASRSGSIIPNHALAGGGGPIVFNFPNYIGSRSELKQAMREAARSFSDLNGRGIAG